MPLRQLYPDPGLGFESLRFDIIAVHGLNWRGKPDAEHAWDTWRTPDGPTGHLWLREDLPHRIPDSRIFLYEWNSSLLLSKAKDGWTDKARELLDSIMLERKAVDPRRPIIFFGHSMGGLLIKQALVNASIDPFYWPIRDATSGIAFFATPHRGARQLLISLGGFASKVARTFRFQRSRGDLIKVLDGTGMFEDLLQEQWKPHMLRYNIVSFWSSKDEYVPEDSSRFNLPREHEAVVKLNADHRGVCKFQPGDPTSEDNLKLVLAHVGDLYAKARATFMTDDTIAPLMRTAPAVPEVNVEPDGSSSDPVTRHEGESSRTGTFEESIASTSPLVGPESETTSHDPSISVLSTSRTVTPLRTATGASDHGSAAPTSTGNSSYGTFACTDNRMPSDPSMNPDPDPDPDTTPNTNDRNIQDILSDPATTTRLISTIAEGAVSPNEIWAGLSSILAPSEDEALGRMMVMGYLQRSVTPEIASLWVKTSISAGALGLLIHDLEVLKARLSQPGASQPSATSTGISNEELQTMMHQTLALHHLNFFASSAAEALAAIERRRYPEQYSAARRRGMIGVGVLVPSLASTFYFLLTSPFSSKTPRRQNPLTVDSNWPGAELDPEQGVGGSTTEMLFVTGITGLIFATCISLGFAICHFDEVKTLQQREKAIQELNMEIHNLQRAMADYEAEVAAAALRSVLDPESPSSSGTGDTSTRAQDLSQLKKSLWEDLGIDLDETLIGTTYNKYALLDRLDDIVQSFKSVKTLTRKVARVLKLPAPKSVVRMSRFRERGLLLRHVTRGGMMADRGGNSRSPMYGFERGLNIRALSPAFGANIGEQVRRHERKSRNW